MRKSFQRERNQDRKRKMVSFKGHSSYQEIMQRNDIQQRFMQMEVTQNKSCLNKGLCSDCGRYNNLINVAECEDSGCCICYKRICKNYCLFECPVGHPNKVFVSNQSNTCEICANQWTPCKY
jgi:hypothetical protein